MSLSLEIEPIPLTMGPDDIVYVGHTRVTLDTVIEAFQEGATAEAIVQQYPSLDLADVYAVIGYYLHRRPEVNPNLEGRRQVAGRIRQQNEARFDPAGIRARLLAQRGDASR